MSFRIAKFLIPLIPACALLVSGTPAKADDWPPISPADLAMKENPAQPGAHAMILYREEIVNGRNQFDSFFNRIKIFSEEGKKLGDIVIPFFKGITEVKEIQARTIHPDGHVVEFDGTVLEKLLAKAGEARFLAKTFTLPDIIPGSIIDYRYKIQHPLILTNAVWQVQEGLYTSKAHFVFMPSQGPFSLYWRTMSPDGRSLSPARQKDGSLILDLSNIPGLPEEEFTLPIAELRGRVEFIYTREQHTLGNAQDYWDRIAKIWADENEKFIGNRGDIRDLAAQVTAPSDSPETKLRKFYARAQQLHNVDFDEEKTFQEEKRDKTKANTNIEDVLKHGYAGVMNTNRFFIALVQAAGFDASLIWVTPRSKGQFHREWQDRSELNDSLVLVHAGDKDYFLNPGIAFCPFGLIPWYETEITAMRPTKEGAVFLKTPSTPSSLSVIERRAQLDLDSDGSLSGTLLVRFTGESALTERLAARNEDEAGRTERITNEIKDWLPANAKIELSGVTGWDKPEAPLEAKAKVSLPNLGESAGKRLLLPLGLYKAGRRQLFSSSARTQDIYFHYPYDEVDNVTVSLPSGWKATSLPQPIVLDPGGLLHYELSGKQESDALHIHRQLTIGGILYPANNYSALRDFFSTAKADDEQQIILQAPASSGGN
jgi:hypothetical protein